MLLDLYLSWSGPTSDKSLGILFILSECNTILATLLSSSGAIGFPFSIPGR